MSSMLEGGLSLLGLFSQYGEIRSHLLAAAREFLLALEAVTRPLTTALEGREGDPAARRALEMLTGLNLLLELVLRRAPGDPGRDNARREAFDTILEVLEAEMELCRRQKPSARQKIRLEVLQSIQDVLGAERQKVGAQAPSKTTPAERIDIE
jgi:hypothetical protein